MLSTAERPAAPLRSYGSGGPEIRRRRSLPPGVGDGAASAALAGLTLASSWGLVRVFSGHAWVAPVVWTAVAVHLVCWASRRLRLHAAAGLVAGAVAGSLAAAWTVLGATTDYGLPTGRTLSTAAHALSGAYGDIPTVVTPVQATTGFVLAAALGAGLAALAAEWLAFAARSALWASVPGLALFVTYCILGYGPGRQWAVVFVAAGVLVFVLVHRVSPAGVRYPWLGGVRSGAVGWALPAGCLVAAGSMLAVAIVAPSVNGVDGHGLLGWRGSGGIGGGPREVANPIVDLHTRLVTLADVGVFTVRSPVPSYWRLTSLDSFTGEAWTATNSYEGFGSRLPGVSAQPKGTRIVTENFRVQALDSVWLPAAFTPLAVSGVRGVGFDPTSSSLITSKRTADGLAYTVTSYQYLATLSPNELQAAPAVDNRGLSRYLALPPVVPPSVYTLARQITAGQRTEYGKAIALQNFFQSSLFRYTLDPPDDGYGINALIDFLFSTRAGYCQQFAGAYAVLARAIGLPTRLAVGFAEGTDVGSNTYQVLDADAHTWPEIYFGPKLGWIPFEPTKSFSDPSASTYAAPAAGAGPTSPNGGSEIPAPARQGTSPTTVGPKNTPAPPTTPAPSRPSSPNSSPGLTSGWKTALVLVALIAAWVSLNAGIRRGRWRFRRWRARGDLRGVVLAHWQNTAEVLAWWGITRHPGDTDREFAARAGRSLKAVLREPSPWVVNGVGRLAVLASEAAFAPAIPPGAAGEAALVSEEIRQRLVRVAPARKLLMWLLIQRPGRAPAI